MIADPETELREETEAADALMRLEIQGLTAIPLDRFQAAYEELLATCKERYRSIFARYLARTREPMYDVLNDSSHPPVRSVRQSGTAAGV